MSDVSPPGRSLLIRVLGLAALLATINAWCIRHLGQDLTKLSFLNAAAAFFGIVFALLRERERKLIEGEKRRRQRQLLDWVLDPAALAGVAILFALAGSFVTFVSVLADGTAGIREVHLTPEGRERQDVEGKRLTDADDEVRFLRWTTPFGRPFYVEVDGYLRYSFDLYPWRGATLRVGRDLRPAPAVLIRVNHEWLSQLDGGRLRISYDGNPYPVRTESGRGSVLLGRAVTVPEKRLEEWRGDLVAAGYQGEAFLERAIRAWKNPIAAEGLPPLGPEATIAIDFFSRAGKPITGTTYTLTGESFQDVELPREREEP